MQDGDSAGSLSRRWAAISGKILLAFVPLIAGCRSDVAQQDAITLARSKGADVRISLKGDALRVDLRRCRMDPELRAALQEMTAVESFLVSADFSDADIDTVDSFPALKNLELSHSKVSGSSFDRLMQLRLLEFLSLNGLTLSDADMDSVARIRQLTSISVVDAKVSEDALRRFRDTNPQCAIAQ